jgi:hypothetical protein
MGSGERAGRHDALVYSSQGSGGRLGPSSRAQSRHTDAQAADWRHHEKTYDEALSEAFQGEWQRTSTEENIQSRIRGNLLMALSNKFGSLLLTTGNKSAIGSGVLHPVRRYERRPGRDRGPPKRWCTGVALAEPEEGRIFPQAILTKAPSAELRPDQTDQDSLPPYELLDQILECMWNRASRPKTSMAQGFDEPTVGACCGWSNGGVQEESRQRPVLKVTSGAFGTGWRMPIVVRRMPVRNKARRESISPSGIDSMKYRLWFRKAGRPMAAVMAPEGHTVIGVER